jgi:hypothetical protein
MAIVLHRRDGSKGKWHFLNVGLNPKLKNRHKGVVGSAVLQEGSDQNVTQL